MKLLSQHQSLLLAEVRRRGSALLLSFLVLLVLVAIVTQLALTTGADAQVAQNDVALVSMDQAIESALLEVYDRLLADAESGGAGGGGEGPPDLGGGLPGEGGGEEQAESVDSHEDSWGRPQRTTINEIELRILIQDEDSKLNVLGMLTEDEEQAEEHFERVVRVIDLAREDTRADIDGSDARRLAEEIRRHLADRMTSVLPKPELLTDDEDNEDIGMPLSLREFIVLDEFHEGLFRDFRDETGTIVHSLGTFLTVWTSLATHEEFLALRAEEDGEPAPEPEAPDGPEAGAAAPPGAEGDEGSATGLPGLAVNINTAPAAVLKGLIDDREVPWRFWDEVVEYRNLEEDEDGEDREPVLDEYGEEIIKRQVFDSIEEIESVPDWDRLGPEERDRVRQLITTQSHVFSIYVTARVATGVNDGFGGYRGAARGDEQEDTLGDGLVRTVRSVIWRYNDGDGWRIVPLVRWDVLDYTPFEVLDYPDPWR